MKKIQYKDLYSELKKNMSLPLFLLLLAGLFNLYCMIRFSVNVPVKEEWNIMDMLSENGSIFDSTSSSRPLIPNFIIYMLYLINGWNVRFNLFLNYFIYIADIILMYRLIVKATGKNKFLPLFFLPFFSDLNALNLMQATALQFHLTVLFGLIAADIGFLRSPTYHNSLLFILFSALSVFSMNLLFAFGIFVGWGIMEIGRKNFRRAGGAAILMLVIFQISMFHSGIMLFSEKQLFQSALILYSAVLTGIDKVTPVHFIFILPVLIALGYLFYKKRFWTDINYMFVYSVIIATFLSALGADRTSSEYMFIHRGAGILLFSIPAVFVVMRLFKPVCVYLCCLCVIGYSASFTTNYFHMEKQARLLILDCAKEYYLGVNEGTCEIMDNQQLREFLDSSKKLKLNYVKGIL